MSVGDLTVFVTETTIFVKCHAQSTVWCRHRPGSLSLKSQANPPGMAKGATGWSFWLLLCSDSHLLIVGALRRIRIVADRRMGREHFMEPSVRRSPC